MIQQLPAEGAGHRFGRPMGRRFSHEGQEPPSDHGQDDGDEVGSHGAQRDVVEE